MFSEYASRFLAQSQSRLALDEQSAASPNHKNTTDAAADSTTMSTNRRYTRPSAGSRLATRSYLQRPSMLGSSTNPYHHAGGSQFVSRFPFASRHQVREAPLFYSATDEFREEDDAEEREREVADYYALQRSRRHFSVEKLSESSEMDDDDGPGTDEEEGAAAGENALSYAYKSGRGIRSSWRGDRRRERRRPLASTVRESVLEKPGAEDGQESSMSKSGRGKLVDVELASSRRSSLDSIDHQEAASATRDEADSQPAPFQTFRKSSGAGGIPREHRWIAEETDDETSRLNPRPPSPDRESVPDVVTSEHLEPPRHDWFWAQLFWICLASLFATSLLVYLHTDEPSVGTPIGDSIYAVLYKSYHLLGVDTLIALIVSAVWLALLRSFIRPLTFLTMIAVPVVLFSFSLYTLVSSYKGFWHGTRFQDKAMRVLSLAPMAATFTWCYLAYKSRYSLDRAIQILEFACKILTASPALAALGFLVQAATVLWFWIWVLLFTRVNLEGHFAGGLWRLDASAWWLNVYFALMLLWVLSVISGLQRAIAAATTSQWYFHRNVQPAPSSRQVVLASFAHATSTLFGTICEQTFLVVAVRLPILLLPRRLVTAFSICLYSIIPSPIAALTNPLTLTYAAIHSQPLTVAARQLSNLPFISRTEATTTLTPTTANAPPSDTLTQYRTAKLILHATRYMMTLAMGLGAWVSTSRSSHLTPDYTGSLYAYVVGLGAAAVGWSVFGAVENVVVGVVDALVVCWASEMASGSGGARYCREAGELFGEQKWGRGDVRV
ncbi:uncharacterized protein PV09_09673 [Verruconis gallopava]|uniref:Protein PNS1 n=1 Tax=Verruconis gallopava TaxID=253628 RepID=A0A0D1YCZ0_9PEZI|nr:uncharacterized protein PV09_09673 [Verruconis gallopava]KIV98521.1 hypothetical protein PV09_09673 [Verruconis gallopava]